MLRKLSIKELQDGLRKKDFSSVEVTKEFLEAIENENLNAFVLKTPELALQMAKSADEAIAKDEMQPLTGIPIGVKDTFCTKGVRTTACSKMLENFIPTYESTVTAKLASAGAITVGKLNMDEFAMGSANINSVFGPSINPWKRDDGKPLVPGGSSGGSAAAVAGNLCPGSIGTDTGGSVRQPASFCGIVGIKPTYGVCSRFGMIAFASSLDQAGVFAHDVYGGAVILQTISGHDHKDSTSAKNPMLQFDLPRIGLMENLKGKKIGIPREYRVGEVPTAINAVWDKGAEFLKSHGAEIVEISLPNTDYALPAYYAISSAEASSNLARYDGIRYGLRSNNIKSVNEIYQRTRGEFFGAEVKRRILTGKYVLSAGYDEQYYSKANTARKLISNDFTKAFAKVDAILTPTAPCDAFAIDEKPDPNLMYLNDIFTVSVNLAGLPAISVPAGLSDNKLPLGLQVIGKKHDEENLINIASVLEKSYHVI